MLNSSSTLKALFSSGTRITVLSHFFLHPGESYYLRQLDKVLQVPVGQLGRELRNLERICLLTSSVEGNQKRYVINQEFPFYDELRSIFLKTTSVGDIVRDSLSDLEGIELAFVYGSFAKAEEHPGSDIDIMVIGDVSDREVNRTISAMERKLKRTINYSLYERKEVRDRLRKKDDFIFAVFEEPHIVLVGSKNDELFRTD